MKIWKRYLLSEVCGTFFLFLFVLFFLFVLIDYSMHMQEFTKSTTLKTSEIVLYYLFQWVKQSDTLLPIALLISMIKVLCSFTIHHEWLALQVSGFRTSTLLKPFFGVATLLAAYGLFNAEYLLPKSLDTIDEFQNVHFRTSKINIQKQKTRMIHTLPLADETKLIYLKYDKQKKMLFDVYWIISSKEIWHSKFLDQNKAVPEGHFVDLLVKNEEDVFEKVSSYDFYPFHGMKLDEPVRNRFYIPIENRSISQLCKSLFRNERSVKENLSAIKTHLSYKLLEPFVSFLIVLGIAPFCIVYSRNLRVFMIYAIALSITITFFVIMNAFAIMGENEVLPPFAAIWGLPTLLSVIFYWNFSKKCLN